MNDADAAPLTMMYRMVAAHAKERAERYEAEGEDELASWWMDFAVDAMAAACALVGPRTVREMMDLGNELVSVHEAEGEEAARERFRQIVDEDRRKVLEEGR